MQCCNMDERTNEEKLLDSNARLREEIKHVEQQHDELLVKNANLELQKNTLLVTCKGFADLIIAYHKASYHGAGDSDFADELLIKARKNMFSTAFAYIEAIAKAQEDKI